jgi:hypothetical protein
VFIYQVMINPLVMSRHYANGEAGVEFSPANRVFVGLAMFLLYIRLLSFDFAASDPGTSV